MNVTISSAYPAGPVLAQQDVSKVETHVAPAEQLPVDQVELSQSAQILALQQGGQGVSQIANSLGVTVASVDSVLGITVPVVAPEMATALAPEIPVVQY